MKTSGSLRILGFGESVPNAAEMVTSDQVMTMLVERGVDTKGKTGADTEKLVGISTRWWSPLTSTEHALHASRAAIADAEQRSQGKFAAEKIQLVHSGGSSPDNLFPACACELQGALGIPPEDCEGRDISLACASWLDALMLAGSRMQHKGLRYGLVAVGESIGSRLNPLTSLSCCLWGDGGGAVLLEYDPEGDPSEGILADKAISDGQYADWTLSKKLGTHPHHDAFELPEASMLDHGKDIHRYAIRKVPAAIEELLAQNALSAEGAFLLPHNANLGMVQQIGKRLGIPEEKVLTAIVDRGNTSSASIPITLARFVQAGTFKSGDLLILAAFGGGMAIDLMLYRWPQGF